MVTVQFQWVMIMVKDNGIGIKGRAEKRFHLAFRERGIQ